MALGSCTLRSRLLTLPSSSQDLQGVQCPASFQGAGPLGPFQPFVYSFNKPLLGISNRHPGAGGFQAHPCYSRVGLIIISPHPPWAGRQDSE